MPKLRPDADGTVGKVKLANWRARRVIENINDIIALCLPGDSHTEQRNKWGSVVDVYIRTIKVSLKKLYCMHIAHWITNIAYFTNRNYSKRKTLLHNK